MVSITIRDCKTYSRSLTPDECKQATIYQLHKVFDISDEYFLEDGKIKKWVEAYHGSDWKEEIRKATKKDRKFFKLLEKVLNYDE